MGRATALDTGFNPGLGSCLYRDCRFSLTAWDSIPPYPGALVSSLIPSTCENLGYLTAVNCEVGER